MKHLMMMKRRAAKFLASFSFHSPPPPPLVVGFNNAKCETLLGSVEKSYDGVQEDRLV